jgi:cold shock CspA family protein
MATGTLKMWKANRGFGFIKDDSGGPDIFLHVTALLSAGIDPENLRLGEDSLNLEAGRPDNLIARRSQASRTSPG